MLNRYTALNFGLLLIGLSVLVGTASAAEKLTRIADNV